VYNSFSQKGKQTEGSSPHFKLRKTHGCHKHIWWYSCNKGGWVGCRAGPQAIQQTKIFRVCRESNLKFSVVQTIAFRLQRLHHGDSATKRWAFLMRGYYAAYSIPCRRFGTSYRVPSSKIASCSETSARNYHCTLRMLPEERRSHLLRGGSLNHAWTFYLTENAASNFRV
jgi:hypothetical protein